MVYLFVKYILLAYTLLSFVSVSNASAETVTNTTKDTPQQKPHNDKPLPVHFRWVDRSNLFDQLSVENISNESLWYEKDFVDTSTKKPRYTLAALHNDKIVGYLDLVFYEDDARVQTFTVHPDYQRKEVGTQLLNAIVTTVSQKGYKHITLDLDETNLSAQQFTRNFGFRATSVERDESDPQKNTYAMQYDIDLAKLRPATAEELAKQNHYERLGVTHKSSKESIKAAHKKEIKKHRNDFRSQELLNEALYTLITPTRRSRYDQQLIAERKRQEAQSDRQALGSRVLDYKSPDPNSPDFYKRIGIFENANRDTITNGYLSAWQKYKKDPKAQEQIKEAFDVLHEPLLRQAYDRTRTASPDDNIANPGELFYFLDTDPNPKSDNLYTRLGIPKTDNQRLIQEAHQRAMRHERGKTLVAQLALSQALQTLTTPVLKAGYDEKPLSSNGSNLKPDDDTLPSSELRVSTPDPDHDNFYQRLGVPENATLDQLEKAYYEAMIQYKEDADARKKLLEAYDRLNSTTKRSTYDVLPPGPTIKEANLFPTDIELEDRMREIKKLGDFLGNYSSGYQQFFDGTLYEKLGVPNNATPDLIRLAAANILRIHNDSPFPLIANQTKNTANILLNPELRRLYDKKGLLAVSPDHLKQVVEKNRPKESLSNFLTKTEALVHMLDTHPQLVEDFLSRLEEKVDWEIRHTGEVVDLNKVVQILQELEHQTTDQHGKVTNPFNEHVFQARRSIAQNVLGNLITSKQDFYEFRKLFRPFSNDDPIWRVFDSFESQFHQSPEQKKNTPFSQEPARPSRMEAILSSCKGFLKKLRP